MKSLLLVFLFLSPFALAQTQLSYPNRPSSAVDDTADGSAQSDAEAKGSAVSRPRDTVLPPGTTVVPPKGPVPATLVYPAPPPAEPPSEFQQFVTAALGRNLPLFGYNLFADVPTTFAPVDRVPVTPEYVIGPGDELLIRAWGQIDLDARLVVDRDGTIYIPKAGSLTVAGLHFAQLQDYIKSAVGKVFRNFDLIVNLGQLRSIQIFVVGQAKRPGTYTVSSLSTLVNALFASGGPSTKGSMRHIQLKRGNKVVTEFDVYDLLLNGDKSKDARLLPGDIIFVPPIGPQVALAGSVNVPAIYELKTRTSLGEALEMAGGLTNVADGQKVRVERIDNHTTRSVDEFPLTTDGETRHLRDADLVYVVPLSPRFENAVTLRGNVAVPGRYPWHSGMRVRDLIPNREALLTRSYWLKQNLTAGTMVSDSSWGADAGRANEAGVQRNGAEVNWDYAVIQRLDTKDLSTQLIPFNLGKAILDRADDSNNVELQPGDTITIFSQSDLRVPIHGQSKFVYLEGEFNSAGVYKANPGETLRGLVKRVGGLTPQAYLYGAEFTREKTREEQQKALDKTIRDAERNLGLAAASATAKPGSTEDAARVKMRIDEQRAQIAKMRELRATGRIVLELPPTADSVDDLPELTLEDGDHFYVPYVVSDVSVAGEVFNSGSFLYEKSKSVSDYLKQAGGPTRYADRNHMFLLRADGSVVPRSAKSRIWTGGFEGLRLMPGDSIIVPQHIPAASALSQVKDWTQIFSQFALGAAAVRILKNP